MRTERLVSAAPEPNLYATPHANLGLPGRQPRAAQLIAEQSLVGALFGGVVGALAGIALWLLAVQFAHHNNGVLTLLVGAAVGLLVRVGGRGLTTRFRAVAVLFAALGAGAGSLATGMGGIYLPAVVGATLVAAGLAPRRLRRADERALSVAHEWRGERD